MNDDPHEYVDLMLDIKDGQVVSCEFYGEGRQVEPLIEPILFVPLDGQEFPRGWKQIERRIKRALGVIDSMALLHRGKE